MAMQGSETVLEQLTCCGLGDFQQVGMIAKLADDPYC